MFHLLALEWHKQKKNRSFQVLIGFYLLLLPTLMLLTKNISEFPPPINSSDAFFQFPSNFMFFGYLGNWLVFFFLGFMAVTFITQEYAYKTLRQNIITGLSRAEYFWSKAFFIGAISLAATLYYTLVVFIYGFTHTDAIFASTITKNIDYIPRYFLMCLGYMSFGFLLGVLVRRTGIALFLYFSYVMFLELILRWGVHLQLFAHKSMHFYPMNAVEDLTPIPFSEAARGFEKDFPFPFFLTPTEATITAGIYTFLFFFAAFRLLTRRDQ
ncbi:MAG: ABC transporter permease [Phaeodactylibacter sp.]|nr:ABC transporter permease [Phaeodactylibacter sp.]